MPWREAELGESVLLWDIDWATVSIHSSRPKRMERVMAAFGDHLAHPSLPGTLAPRLRSAGFADVEMQVHAFASFAMDPEAYGCRGVAWDSVVCARAPRD